MTDLQRKRELVASVSRAADAALVALDGYILARTDESRLRLAAEVEKCLDIAREIATGDYHFNFDEIARAVGRAHASLTRAFDERWSDAERIATRSTRFALPLVQEAAAMVLRRACGPRES